jgi:hypothetical protein
LTIPIARSTPSAGPDGAREAPPTPQSSGLGVVVEDNEDAADMMAAWLEQLGHEVRVARTGAAGVALAASAIPW